MRKIKQIKLLGFPWETQDPFLFCAYHKDQYPAGNGQLGIDFDDLKGRNTGSDFIIKDGWRMYHGSNIPGFPFHPHRGFETITINKQGVVDHSDSLGAAGRFMKGDVQWMTAGKGIQHSEMFPLINEDKPNPLEIFQVWLNLPKAKKFVEPHFKMLWKEVIPVVKVEDENGNATNIEVICGTLNGIKAPGPTPESWAANPENAVGIFTVKMQANAKWILPATKSGANRSIYFYKGSSIVIEGEIVKENHLVYLEAHEDTHIQNGKSEGFLLILEGKPIQEPVVQHGPFVMNSQQEIQQAFDDYRRTEFGGWPWNDREPVHPKDKGKFALHADGREEASFIVST